jgi:hypothetical protein
VTVHPQFASWTRRFVRNTYVMLVPFIVAIGVSDCLFIEYQGVYFDVAAIVLVLFFAFFVYEFSWIRSRTLRWFVRQWNQEHKPAPQPP